MTEREIETRGPGPIERRGLEFIPAAVPAVPVAAPVSEPSPAIAPTPQTPQSD